MIAVIADDLTGAAEIAGIGLRYNLEVEICTRAVLPSNADLLVISTDSRSMSRQDAVRISEQVTAAVAAQHPELVYKKVDSALRGHAAAELGAMLITMGLEKALVVPANPAHGRKIINGLYYVHGQPIHLTGFSEDPEFPISSSYVSDMITAIDMPVYVLNKMEALPAAGIVVGEVATEDDLGLWASATDQTMLPAGGSGFFTALMNRICPMRRDRAEEVFVQGHPSLYISGTAFRESMEAVSQIKFSGGPVSYMPGSIVHTTQPSRDQYETWSEEVIELLSRHGKAIIAIEADPATTATADAKQLREKTAEVVKVIFEKTTLNEIYIEGGSTASAVIRKLGFSRFIPVQELSAGVVRMKVPGTDALHITIKPGSYPWPRAIWKY